MNMISTAFPVEADASSRQELLVKKLVTIWEKKNSKVARAGGLSLMALSLAACGAEDETPFAQADIDVAVAAANTVATVAATEAAALAVVTQAEAVAAATIVATATAEATAADEAAAAAIIATITQEAAVADAAAAATTVANATAATAATAAAAAATAATAVAVAAANATSAAAAAALKVTTDAALATQVALYDAVANPAAINATMVTTTVTSSEVISGTASNDTVTATQTTFNASDVVMDTSTTDTDTLILNTTANITAGAVVSGFEVVTINHTAWTDGAFTVTSIAGAPTITLNNIQAAGATGGTLTDLNTGATVVGGSGVTGTLTTVLDGAEAALTVTGAAATTIAVGQDTGGTATAASYTITSTKATGLNVNVEGSTLTTDAVNVSAKGAVAIDYGATVDSESNAVETATLSGNGAAATYTVSNNATTTTIAGDQNVTVKGAAAQLTGKTITDTSTATSTVELSGAGTLDATKIAVDNINISVDNIGNVITVDSGEKLQVDIGQTSLTLTSAAASKATNSVEIDVSDGAGTVGTVALGVLAGTNIANYNITATDNVSIANSATVAATGTINISGAGTAAVGTTGTSITAAAVNASGMSGALTAFIGSNLSTITGGSGADNITIAADINFTVDGGTGSDTLTILSASTDIDFSDNTTTSLAGIEIVQFDDTSNVTTHTFDGSLFHNGSMIIKGEGTGNKDVIAFAMDNTTLNVAGINADSTTMSGVTITSTAVANSALTITGTAMADTITSGNQDDVIVSGAGNDIISNSGAGDDTIDTGAGDDTVSDSGAGNDTIILGEGTNIMSDSGAGNDVITGGSGNDTMTDLGSGNDTATLFNGVNIATGNSGDDTISGGTGVDTFSGGANADTLTGAGGADFLYGDNAGSKEVITYTVTNKGANTSVYNLTIMGTLITYISNAANAISVTTQAATMKAAVETAFGGATNDYFAVTQSIGALTITSKLDSNLLTATESASGTSAAATISEVNGGASSGGVDTINAGTGSDFVYAGEGNDTISLGASDASADTVVYLNKTHGMDTINNFESGSGADVLAFARSVTLNGTEIATLQSIASNGTVGTHNVFVEITTATGTGGADTAAEIATHVTNLGLGNVANNDEIVFAINDGADTYLWHATEDGTAGLEANDWVNIGKLTGVTDIANGDLAFIA